MNTIVLLASTCGVVWLALIVLMVVFFQAAGRPTPAPPAATESEADV